MNGRAQGGTKGRRCLLTALLSVAVCAAAPAQPDCPLPVPPCAPASEIRPGALWHDTAGHVINAHGGGVLFDDGVYWWYGEHKVYGRAGNRAHVGVHVYSSRDLVNWDDRGVALAVSDDPQSDIADGCILERPKVLRSRKTGHYVMYFHLELKGQGYGSARTGLAVADRPEGPFRFLRSFRPTAGTWPVDARAEERTPEAMRASKELGAESGGPSERVKARVPYLGHIDGGQMSRDMTLFADDDGRCYHVFASEYNATLHIAELTDDLLGYTGRWFRMAEKHWTEAPALVKRGGWYFLLGSGCTGWKPNAARLYRAKSLRGPWERLGNPCRGVSPATGLGPELTWGAQSTFLLPVAGRPDEVIALFDVWNPANHEESRYVWLPVTFEDDRLRIDWKSSWRVTWQRLGAMDVAREDTRHPIGNATHIAKGMAAVRNTEGSSCSLSPQKARAVRFHHNKTRIVVECATFSKVS